MGGVISTATDFVVEKLCSCFCLEVHHICRLDKNLETLVQDMEKLKARRDDVLKLVKMEEDRGLQRLSGVDVWLTAVRNIENEASETLMSCTSELQGLPLCDGCSRKLVSRFRFGKGVFSMLEDVKELTGRKLTEDIKALAVPPVRKVVRERDLEQNIVGQETILESSWSRLMDDRTQIMGLYGMGGVGKTTLLDQLRNKFCGAKDWVGIVIIWVVVSTVKRNEKIQDEIAEKLGLEGELWKQKTETQKASSIRNSLETKRFVLFLDDIWSKVELKGIGVPFPSRENKCKIVFTTRSRDVCARMGDTNPVEVSCLDTEKAWELFKEKVGERILGSHRGIPELARKVAGKCHGLPLALNVLGETMSSQVTIQEWRHAVTSLTSNAAKISGMDEILPVLKYSYDSLKEHLKPCFLYCSLFPEDFEISKDRLIEYWICEGFIKENQSREKAFDEGYSIISSLLRACLLLEEPVYKVQVKMHDVVREMALWVASDLGEHEGRYTVQAGAGLREIPEVESWRAVRKISLMNNEIKELSGSPCCPELTTLLLQENKLATISSEFFRQMPRLLVLDLSKNSWFSRLPEKMSELVALRYLDLSGTTIERLPVGLQKSRMLICLNLESTLRLDNVSGISKFSRLRRLGLWNSKTKLDMSLLEELQLLKYLQVVTIGISSCLVAEKLSSYDRVVKCIKKLEYKDLQDESFRVLPLPTMDNLCDLEIEKCGMTEIKAEGAATSLWNRSPTSSPSFLNLSTVYIIYCNGLKDLTWLLFAPNLTILNVGRSTQIEYIISQEKATNGVTGTIIPFANLEHFSFYCVPMLKSIYWSALPFQSLKGIRVGGCPNLRKLSLDSESVANVEGFGIQCIERHWISNIEWEDEATKLRFQASFKNS